jgi:hypothetical protein
MTRNNPWDNNSVNRLKASWTITNVKLRTLEAVTFFSRVTIQAQHYLRHETDITLYWYYIPHIVPSFPHYNKIKTLWGICSSGMFRSVDWHLPTFRYSLPLNQRHIVRLNLDVDAKWLSQKSVYSNERCVISHDSKYLICTAASTPLKKRQYGLWNESLPLTLTHRSYTSLRSNLCSDQPWCTSKVLWFGGDCFLSPPTVALRSFSVITDYECHCVSGADLRRKWRVCTG